jgi:hypothetical protein
MDHQLELVSSSNAGWFAILLIGAIVLIDVNRFLQMSHQVPKLGELNNGGWAWASDIESELNRNWAHLLALGVMILLPWVIDELFAIPVLQIIVLDILLIGMALLQIKPKRYAITRQHLYTDGFRYDWHRLGYRGWKGGSRIVLLRRGWGPFAPLPLGGIRDDLEQAALRIDAASSEKWDELLIAIDGLQSEE